MTAKTYGRFLTDTMRALAVFLAFGAAVGTANGTANAAKARGKIIDDDSRSPALVTPFVDYNTQFGPGYGDVLSRRAGYRPAWASNPPTSSAALMLPDWKR